MARFSKAYPPADLSRVKRSSIKQRANKSRVVDFGQPLRKSGQANRFLDSLPGFLKAADLIEFIEAVVKARSRNKPFHLLLGAHTIKVGLSPILVDLMKQV